MKVSFVINIINLVSFVQSFDACQMGCGTQDTTGLRADFLCEDQREETMETVQQPGDNAQCKVVRIRNRDFRCRFRNRIRIEDNQAIFVSHTEGARFYHIFSPGFNTDSCYDNTFVCAYEVECGIDELLYYHITIHDIESPANKVCYDQLGVERESRKGEFRSSCGRVGTGMLDFDDLEVAVNGVRSRNSSMVVTFFSGTTCMARGYFMFAECVNVSRQDTPQCVDSIVEKKRQISDRFDERFPFLSHTLTARNFEILVGEKFTYSSNTIKSGLNLFTLDKIWALVVFHRENGRLVYYRGTSETFFGYGILRVRNGLALYVDYDAPPRFHPTEDQEIYLSEILSILTFQYPGEDYPIVDLDSINGTQPTEPPVTGTVIFPTTNTFSTSTFTNPNATQPDPLPTNTAPDPPRLLQDPCAINSALCAESLERVNSCNAIVRENAQMFLDTCCVSIII